MLGWPKRCKLAHAFLWEYSYKRLKLAQLLGQLGIVLTLIVDATPLIPTRQDPRLQANMQAVSTAVARPGPHGPKVPRTMSHVVP